MNSITYYCAMKNLHSSEVPKESTNTQKATNPKANDKSNNAKGKGQGNNNKNQNKSNTNNKQQQKQPGGKQLTSFEKGHEVIFNEASKIDKIETDEDEWSTDVSEEAVMARRQSNLVGMLGNMAASTNESNTRAQLHQTLKSDQPAASKVAEIISIQKKLNMGEELRTQILFDYFFNNKTPFLEQIKNSKPIFELCDSVNVAKTQKVLLGLLCQLAVSKQLISSFKDMLFAFYDNELLSEDVILNWYEVKVSSMLTTLNIGDLENLRKEAFPFIEWLNAASEEDEEGDDGEE